MRQLTKTEGNLMLAIAQAISHSQPELAQRVPVAALAELLAESQAVMDASGQHGQVVDFESMVKLIKAKK